MDDTTPFANGPWIEILGGRTRFPRRPITGDRVLIGSGSNCHLQLGGGIPMAHSVLVETPEGWVIEALVAEPAVFVNGEPTRRSLLIDGAALSIGPFQFRLHLPEAVENELLAPLDVEALIAQSKAEGSFTSQLEHLSAEELLDGLTAELAGAAIADQGASAAASLIDEAAHAEGVVSIDEEQLVAEVMAQIAAMAASLESRCSGVASTDDSPSTLHEPVSTTLRRSA